MSEKLICFVSNEGSLTYHYGIHNGSDYEYYLHLYSNVKHISFSFKVLDRLDLYKDTDAILVCFESWFAIIENNEEEEIVREIFKELNPYLLDCLTFGVEPEPGIYGNVRPEV